MVDIVSRIKLLFQAQGGEKAAKETEKVGRAQTRLGQASASAGRQFSAQASGLGGLVSVYAGAAANIFALSMAFTALQRAAQAEQVVIGTRVLAQEIGASGDTIIAKIRDITDSQLSLVDTATQANAALSAGFSSEQIERLTVVSNKASRALGRDLSDSFNRLVRGAAKLEPELIDELGIFARIIPATEAYAAANNVAASSLTNFEKRQAFVNAIIKEGEDKFGEIDTTSENTQKSFEKLLASVQDLAMTFGQFIGSVLTPIVDFFGGSIGNKMMLFGAIGLIVFGKLRQAIGAFASDTLSKLNLALDVTFTKMNRAGAGSAAAIKTAFDKAREAAAGGGMRITGPGTRAAISGQAELKGLLAKQGKEGLGFQAAAEGARLAQAQLSRLAKLGFSENSKQAKFATAALAAFQAQTGALGPVTKGLTVALGGLKVALIGIGAVISKALPYLQLFMIAFIAIQTVLSMFGFDLIGKIVEMFKSIGRESAEMRAGLSALGKEINRTSGATSDYGKKLNLTEKQVKNAHETNQEFIEDLIDNKKMQDRLTGSLENQAKSIARQNKLFTIWGVNIAPIYGGLTDVDKILEKLRKGGGTGRALQRVLDPALVASIEKNIEKLQAAYDKSGKNADLFALRLAKGTKELLVNEEGILKNRLQMIRIAGQFSATGLQAKGLAAALDTFDITGEGTNKTLTFMGITMGTVEKGQARFAAGFNETGAAIGRAAAVMAQWNYRNKNGKLDAEKAAQSAGALSTAISVAKAEARAAEKDTAKLNALLAAIDKRFSAAAKSANKLRDSLKALEQIGKNIRDTYSGAFKSLDNLFTSGKAGLNSSLLATSGEEQAKNAGEWLQTVAQIDDNHDELLAKMQRITDAENRIAELKRQGYEEDSEAVKAIKNQLTVNGEIGKLTSEERQTASNISAARKAIVARIVEGVMEAGKMVKAQEKALKAIQGQVNQLKKRNELLSAQQELSDLTATNKANMDIEKAKLETTKSRYKFEEELGKLQLAGLKQNQEILKINKENLDIDRKRADAKNKLTGGRAARAEAGALLGAQQQQTMTQAMGPLATRNQLIEAELNVAEVQYKNKMESLKREEALVELQKKRDLADITAKERDLRVRKQILEQENINNREKFFAQLETLSKERELEVQRKNDRIAEIDKAQKVNEKQRELANLSAKVAKETREAGFKLLDAQVKALKARIIADKTFIKGLSIYLKGAAAIANEMLRASGQTVRLDFLEVGTRSAQEMLSSYNNQLDSQVTLLERNIKLQREASANIETEQKKAATIAFNTTKKKLDEEVRGLQEVEKEALNRYNNEVAALGIARQAQYELSQTQIAGIDAALGKLDLERETIRDVAALKLQELGLTKDAAMQSVALAREKARQERDVMFQLTKDITGFLKQRVGTAIQDLFKALREGTLTMENFKEGAQQFALDILGGIQEKIIQHGIVKPIEDMIARGMTELTGFDMTKPDGSQMKPFYVKMAGSSVLPTGETPADLGGKLPGDPLLKGDELKTAKDQVGMDLKGIGTLAVGTFAAVFAATGDFKKSMIATFLAMFIKIMIDSIMAKTFMGAVSGGAVGRAGAVHRFAAGGAATASAATATRDRVPALLEPGEFVIRKPIAKAIGGPALQRMNATGQTPGNVAVNVTNKGTPQQVDSAQPKFDAQGMVVEIVMKDLQNNGPIKQSLRSGGKR